MPFTISHIAAVLPLFRWNRLDPLALAIGSMAPDFGYFIQHFDLAGRAHGIHGSIVVALPLAWLAWFAARAGSEVLSCPLPNPHRRALAGFLTAKLPDLPFFWVSVSLLLGIWSHTILDSFTHASGWTVLHVNLLHEPWPVYHGLQHLGSVAGMLILVVSYLRWKNRTYRESTRWTKKHLLLPAAAFLALALAIPMAWSFASRFDGFLAARAFVFRGTVTAMGIFACTYVLLGAMLTFTAGDRRKNGVHR